MRRVTVAIDARMTVAGVLALSRDSFGPAAAKRYRALIEQAYADLAQNPERAGVSRRDDIPADLHLYPIRHSRNRVPAGLRVDKARHVIAFRFDSERVQIVHLLHDAMDFPGRLT